MATSGARPQVRLRPQAPTPAPVPMPRQRLRPHQESRSYPCTNRYPRTSASPKQVEMRGLERGESSGTTASHSADPPGYYQAAVDTSDGEEKGFRQEG